MTPVFLEAILRSFFAGLVVAAGLWILRVRNVAAKKAAWGLVLVSAFFMPLLLAVAPQWHLLPARIGVVVPAEAMTLLEELQARILAKSGPGIKAAAPAAATPQSDPSNAQNSPALAPEGAARTGESSSQPARAHVAGEPAHGARSAPLDSAASSSRTIAQSESVREKTQFPGATPQATVSARILVLILYFSVAALFLFRLALGIAATIRLWRMAAPVPASDLPADLASLPIRASTRVASPITIGSAILLPADYRTWESEKLRIVVAHERSHIRQGDFYLQLLASLYAALAWFSPLGWWLKHELAELGEAISDRAGIEEAESRASYAQILLEFAATPHRISIGVAMARPGSLSRRIELLLNDNSFRQCFAGGPRALMAVVLVPLVVLAATALVRVQAASAVQAVTGTQFVSPARTATSTPADATAFLTAPLDTQQTGPAVAAVRIEGQEQAAPATQAVQVDDQELAQTPMTQAVLPASPEQETVVSTPVAEMAMIAAPARQIRIKSVFRMVAGGMQEGEALSFDRTISAGGATKLAVFTGSGNIHLTRGSSSQIHIHGKIHVNRDGSEEVARQIAANPPIEQDGDTIRVGQHHNHDSDEDRDQWRGISIDYQIEAPAGIQLSAMSGSGDIVDEGVGQDAKLQTGSGDIKATSLEGPFVAKTGSGNITAAQTGQGDVVAETGSGDIELKDIRGGFKGQTGSGDIKASGTPSAGWNLQTGSGNIELWTGSSPLTLDASTGSGSVKTDHEMMVQGTLDKHHIRGELNGGGPTVRVQTGSGDVQIH